jgi:hypothetical protein
MHISRSILETLKTSSILCERHEGLRIASGWCIVCADVYELDGYNTSYPPTPTHLKDAFTSCTYSGLKIQLFHLLIHFHSSSTE